MASDLSDFELSLYMYGISLNLQLNFKKAISYMYNFYKRYLSFFWR